MNFTAPAAPSNVVLKVVGEPVATFTASEPAFRFKAVAFV